MITRDLFYSMFILNNTVPYTLKYFDRLELMSRVMNIIKLNRSWGEVLETINVFIAWILVMVLWVCIYLHIY